MEQKDKAEKRDIDRPIADLGGYGKYRFIGKWSVAAIYGPDWTFRSLSAKTDQDLGLLNQRKDTERFVNAFTTGLEVRLKARAWSILSGLHYSQINERNRYTLEDTEHVGTGGPIKGSLTRSIVNRTSTLQIPILLGYEFNRGAWSLEINAGASFGLKTWTSGEVFDERSLTYVEYDSESQENPYVGSGIHSWQVGASLAYKVGFDQQIFIRPYYRSYTSVFTQESYGLEQKFNNVGLLLGCRYSL